MYHIVLALDNNNENDDETKQSKYHWNVGKIVKEYDH